MARILETRRPPPAGFVHRLVRSRLNFRESESAVRVVTHQQEMYQVAYQAANGDYGFPDRNLAPSRASGASKIRILAVGGGTANDLWFLTSNNVVVNIDYAMSGLRAGARHGVRGVAADLNLGPSLPFADHTFDLVVCKDILEHLLDPLAILGDAKRVLREDGEIVISVPNHFYWPIRLRILLGKGLIWRGPLSDHAHDYQEWNYMHVRFFTYKGFRKFLDTAGLRAKRFYWDFGNLAYYYNPDRWFEPQLWKRQQHIPLSRRAKIALTVLRPLWRIFNFVFPRWLRAAIVRFAPGLLCAGFYVRCVKK